MVDSPKRPDLKAQRALIFHNYDLLIERQARLHTLSVSKCVFASEQIYDKQQILLLDDLSIFAISCRRIIDICGLQSRSNDVKIAEIRIDWTYEPLRTCNYDGRIIGFYNVVNRIIHMSNLRYFDNRALLKAAFRHGAPRLGLKSIFDEENFMDGIFLLQEYKHGPILIRLRDLIEASVEVCDLIMSRCELSDVYLEPMLRS